MDLKELRAKLDEIDPKIVELFEQRMELCKAAEKASRRAI